MTTQQLLHIPDISEHQATVDMSKVGPAVILRAHNGRRADRTFAQRQKDARRHCQVRGFYLYLVKDRSALVQANEAAALIGKLQPGEFCVVDLEEGTGDQSGRAQMACARLDELCGGHAWVYSGLAFDHDHLIHVSGRRLWIAAYRAQEPTGPQHTLWQHTDAEPHPGIGKCDCSIFHGTVAQLRALISPPPPAKKPAPAKKAPAKAAAPAPAKKAPAKPPVAKPAGPSTRARARASLLHRLHCLHLLRMLRRRR